MVVLDEVVVIDVTLNVVTDESVLVLVSVVMELFVTDVSVVLEVVVELHVSQSTLHWVRTIGEKGYP